MLFSFLVTLITAQNLPNSTEKEENVRKNFANLLKSIVKVNENRVETLKKLTQLKESMLNSKSRFQEEGDLREDSEEDVLIFRKDKPESQRRLYNGLDKKLLPGTLNKDQGPDSLMDTRRSWRGSCNRKIAKTCRRACLDAHRNVCRIYRCGRGVKRTFKKECRRTCRYKFERSDSETEWE
ncbi:hypothetical protein K1T71_013894 [Dendrolimus kikuchii]|uniref:Uncharacterized protein n=1 Tax=Dendrolimus kikuchii TaxID=765133 RepID=A0ACC1CG15_9NEOP|nr:hypothetical protein K1T71_013894 [Dendrolimus kikuchii]